MYNCLFGLGLWNMVVWVSGFCGHWRFSSQHTAGGNFLFSLCLYSKCSEVSGDFMHRKYGKQFCPLLLPTSDFIPHTEHWGPPRRQGLCRHCLPLAPEMAGAM